MVNSEITEKRCTLCKKVKPVAEFHSEFVADELTNRCSDCRARGQRAHAKYVGANREQKRSYEAKYRARRLRQPCEPECQVCRRCTKRLAIEEFAVAPSGERYANCDPCREYMRMFQRRDRAKWPADKRLAHSAAASLRHKTIRMEVLEHYGKRCACCGTEYVEFLAIDHIKGDGGKHRADIHASGIFRWLKKHGFPDGFRTLCFNCNWSFGAYGYCPHQAASG